MSATEVLYTYWTEWKALTLVESKEIQEGNWESLAAAQHRKMQLRELMQGLPFPAVRPPREEKLLQEIISQEQLNAKQLAERLENLSQQLDVMGRDQRVLGQVRGAYVPRQGGVWSSYS